MKVDATNSHDSEFAISEVVHALGGGAAFTFSYIDLLTPSIIAISASIALWGVFSARRLARQKATLDMIEKAESTPHYMAQHEVFSKHRNAGTLLTLNTAVANSELADRRSVMNYLNNYELIAIGISEKILEENFYRKWMQGPFVRDWNAAGEFIQRERWKRDSNTGL